MKFTYFILSLVVSLSLWELGQTAAPMPTEIYANHLVLQEPDLYHLYWNFTESDILFEVHVMTDGWVGFGLSPNGGMDGSDVIVTWIDPLTGAPNFTDRHIVDRSVLIDAVQNWYPLFVCAQEGYLIAKFTRKIRICDETNEDMDIPDGTPFVIFAYGTSFGDQDIAYHGSESRGTRSVQLTSALNALVEIDMSQMETIEFRVNVGIYKPFFIEYNEI